MIVLLVNYISQIVVLAGWLTSGEVAFGHPAYKGIHDALDGLVLWSGGIIAFLVVWELFGVWWYRKTLRTTEE
ncbi:hypothetical protein AB0N24_26215 [Arthrobacter sp. NPDC093128]|uniref:hypothetical protein n=1 Tax=Arthrobacter sp. NPDC093128 TaxID=3154979 RepID=UPI00344AACBD